MSGARVLVAGSSIAGPALAHWLRRRGAEVTVVERAPRLRPGGQAVDARGVAKEVIRRMGLDAAVRASCTDTAGAHTVDVDGNVLETFRADDDGGDGFIAEIEILRGDLSRVLHDDTRDGVEYLFGDRIAELTQDADGVDVAFAGGDRRRFDLVIGADGLHSALRTMVFGPRERFVRHLGMVLAFYTVPNGFGVDRWLIDYQESGRSAGLRPLPDTTRAMAMLSFTSADFDVDHRDVDAQKRLLRERMADFGWLTPRILTHFDDAPDFYLDQVAQVVMDRWSSGRVGLIGDAAFSSSPMSGGGTGLALVGAYLLAGELAAAGWDPAVAFAAYEARMRPYVEANQEIGRMHVQGRDAPGPSPEPDMEALTALVERAINGVESCPTTPGCRTPPRSAVPVRDRGEPYDSALVRALRCGRRRSPGTATARPPHRQDGAQRTEGAVISTPNEAGIVAVAGEALVDLVPAPVGGYLEIAPGGSAANVAVGLARLGVPARMLARIADDPLGRRVRNHLASNGVALEHAASASEQTSMALITVDEEGVPSYDFRVAGTADWQWTSDELRHALDGPVVAVHAGSLALTTPPGAVVLRALLARAAATATISYDPNCRPLLMGSPADVLAGAHELLVVADVVKVSAEDLEWLCPGTSPEAVVEDWVGRGPALVAVTLGGDGVLAGSASGLRTHRPGVPVTVVDTVGAGDTFSAALLAGLHGRALLGADRRAALRTLDGPTLDALLDEAARAAAITCSRRGADPPTRAELRT